MYTTKQPYGEWLDSNLVELKDLKIPNMRVEEYEPVKRKQLQKAFGYTYEEYRNSIRNMALNGGESIAAMGVDTPLAVLSDKRRPLFDYFKQLFAQVTNPPIDAAREEIVTNTSVYIGKEGNLLKEYPENCQVLKVKNPILSDTDLLKIKNMKVPGFSVKEVPIICYKNTPFDKALERLFLDVDKAYKDGATIVILTDRGVDETHVALPSLLAVSAVHHYLVRTRKSTVLISDSWNPGSQERCITLQRFWDMGPVR